MSMYAGKQVLVTGGTGMIGIPLVEMLIERGAAVRIVSLDAPERAHPRAEFIRANLLDINTCLRACEGMDYVFHLAGIKGSPAMTSRKPASFFVPTILFNTNMMEAARKTGVERYLFTSTIGVYHPAAVFHEDDVWKTFPSENDRFAGWAKRMGELQAEAYRIEHGWETVAIVRPANVYGPFDNFDPANAMVIPSLIRRVMDGENPLRVWGDGSAVRDFIHARDVAAGMLLVMEKMPPHPVNLGSGEGVSIRQLVEIILDCVPHAPAVEWDTTQPSGDASRLMDMTRACALGFEPAIGLAAGIREVVEWFQNHRGLAEARHNVFRSAAYI
jgi:GDP-L-fucose synthase